jgi:hypothetical protein
MKTDLGRLLLYTVTFSSGLFLGCLAFVLFAKLFGYETYVDIWFILVLGGLALVGLVASPAEKRLWNKILKVDIVGGPVSIGIFIGFLLWADQKAYQLIEHFVR